MARPHGESGDRLAGAGPAALIEDLFWRAAGPLIGDDEPSAVLLAGMMVCAADGILVNVADTPEYRAMFGCTGTAPQDGEGSAPFPQVRIVALTARAGRAMLGAICGRARAGEQTLLARLVRRRKDNAPVTADEESFTASRHHAIRSITSSQLTASSSLEALAAAAGAAARAALAHPQRSRTATALAASAESAPEIRACLRDQADRHRETRGHRVRPRILITLPPEPEPAGKEEQPRPPGPWTVEPRARPAATRGRPYARTPPPPPRKQTQRQTQDTRTITPRNTSNT
jgi:hypothetical protein